ncbi:LOW QUALITY PROTEIN: EF-hand domain-containing protein 1-like [Paramacrobiotus metropolitanus]|uniref:LOW QUALITY PROTEIN: EF-hand domain-containing protein 1-like n=1 Tax=Paramacrobiotus metropolitanus TaxID=2943436 RepID=UPI0024465129|nr:LOW QUALITY PROTEIN: EF-hand domain-containing protein 1-like [Paramacrobiotus metropolitanus]
MDPFSWIRPEPVRTRRHFQLINGYPVVPVSASEDRGPRGYDTTGRYEKDHNTQHFAHPDAVFQDPAIHGNLYPSHLVYRRKSGEEYVIPSKTLDKATPKMRILPQSALYANMVLRYYGYFLEDLKDCDPHYPEYGYRVRQVVVYYHLEDDTIHVFEPPLENFGVEQGVLCPRGVYYRPRNGLLVDREPYQSNDFKLGNDYIIGPYKIRLYEADAFTKKFWVTHFPMDSIGTPEAPKQDPVWEKSTAKRDLSHRLAEYKRNRKPLYPPNPYHLEVPDDKKLQFVGILDDTNFPLARCRPVVVEYYFCDETIRVMEFRIDNDAHPFGSTLNTVIRRSRIPKNPVEQQVPSALGPIEKPTPEFTYYEPKDFCIGNTLRLHGRHILLVECTEWTRRWWDENCQPAMPANADWRSRYQRRPHKAPRDLVVPEHNGLGTHDDSMKSVMEIQPQARPVNELPQLCFSDDTFKYSAKQLSHHPDAHLPDYSIIYYMADNTIAVYEHTVPGDATYGRKFLRRQQCPIPDYQPGPFQRTPMPAPIYDWRHFLPGNVLNLWGTRFRLTTPDPGILRILEKHNLFTGKDLIYNYCKPKAQAVPRALKCMQKIKYWILHNPKYLLLLLSEGDVGSDCIVTRDLVEKVCTSGGLDVDRYCAEQMVNQAREHCKKMATDHLYVEEFIKYVFEHAGSIAELQTEMKPPRKETLKFRLDSH